MAHESEAQGICVDVTVVVEQSILEKKEVSVLVLSKADTLSINQRGLVCIEGQVHPDSAIDVFVGFRDRVIPFRSLYPGFLNLFDDEIKWLIKIDQMPFNKKDYPRVKKWKNVEEIHVFRSASKNSEDGEVLYTRRKGDRYVD